MSSVLVCPTFKKVLIASVFGVGMFLIPNGVQSADNNSATLQWAPNPESDLEGYKVYHGTTPGNYTDYEDAGNTVIYRYANLAENKTHYFTVIAYDTSGNDSSPSPEVTKTIVAPDRVLSVSINGEGTVRSSPAGLSCSNGTCSGMFTQGSSVVLTADPGIGKTFAGWDGACTGISSCEVTVLTSSPAIHASFASSAPPSVSATLVSSPPPAWSSEEQKQLVQAKEQKQLARVEELKAKEQKQLAQAREDRAKAQKQLAQAKIKRAREQMRVAKTPEQKAQEQKQLAQAQEQKQWAQAREDRAKEQKKMAKAKQQKAKEQKKLAKAKQQKAQEQKKMAKAKGMIFRIQNALARIETRLAKINRPEVVARLIKQKEKYSMVLARVQERYSMN